LSKNRVPSEKLCLLYEKVSEPMISKRHNSAGNGAVARENFLLVVAETSTWARSSLVVDAKQ
jgi:hypothetical protein